LALDVVAVAAAVAFFDDIARAAEIGDDPVRRPLRHTESRREIPQSSFGLVRKEEHYPGVRRQEAPVGHTYQ
jgi:hypothetical protein